MLYRNYELPELSDYQGCIDEKEYEEIIERLKRETDRRLDDIEYAKAIFDCFGILYDGKGGIFYEDRGW